MGPVFAAASAEEDEALTGTTDVFASFCSGGETAEASLDSELGLKGERKQVRRKTVDLQTPTSSPLDIGWSLSTLAAAA